MPPLSYPDLLLLSYLESNHRPAARAELRLPLWNRNPHATGRDTPLSSSIVGRLTLTADFWYPVTVPKDRDQIIERNQMLTKINPNTYQTEDGFPELPLWIGRPDQKGSRFVHWSGDDGYDRGCDRISLSVVTSVSSYYDMLTFDYHDWEGETWGETMAVYARIGRERLVQLREETNALLRKAWREMDEWPWRGPHPDEDRMLDDILPLVVRHDWKTLGF